MRKLNHKIVGLSLISLLVTAWLQLAVPTAHAIYSPVLYKHVQLAKTHLKASRVKNGAGTAANAWDKWRKHVDQQAKSDPWYARVSPPNFVDAVATIKGDISLALEDAVASFQNLFGFAVGSSISACIRNDIYEMEDTAVAVGDEMVRTGILFDDANYILLKQDYVQLRYDINFLRNNFDDEKNLFPDGGENYYLSGQCPAQEWNKAIESFIKDFDYFVQSIENVGSGDAWGSILEMAEKRGKRQGEDWIKKNQLKVTLGGENGASDKSLIKDAVGLGAQFSVFWDKLKSLTPLDSAITAVEGVYQDTTEWLTKLKSGLSDRDKELARIKTALQYQLRFQGTIENSLIDFDKVLAEMEGEIKNTYSGQNAGLQKLIEQMSALEKGFCKNRAPESS
ncbi:hypothetical protein HZA43_00375 [Candidatus Peregrinibacteria bacterium]|nr:hypothetical protein [Candidatus Peregrinibacteria bacterium]